MKIYLSSSTAARSGGGLRNKLSFLDRTIQQRLDDSGFKCSFEELWLTLAYPPMYILPGVVGMEIKFNEYYNTYPYSRINRKYKKIEITLKAPEFSEYFDKAEHLKYKNKFTIEKEFENISDVELAKILIDKFIMAGDIINGKLKKEDAFDYSIYKETLLNLKGEISLDFLIQNSTEQASQISDYVINHAINLRKQRAVENKPKDKPIRDLRIYYVDLPLKALYPFDFIYTEIFLNLLSKNRLMCPTYHHLYIQVGENMEECLKKSIPPEDWFINGIALIDYKDYLTKTNEEKDKIVFETIIKGLQDIFTIDKLDIEILNKIIQQIAPKGLNTELEWTTIENSKYILKVTYFSRSVEEGCPVYFTLTDKATLKEVRFEIGKAQNNQIYYWLQKINITNSKITVKSSESSQADWTLYDKPRILEFDIATIMK